MRVSKKNNYILHTVIYFLLTFGSGFIQTDMLTPLGMSVVGVFVGMVYGWTFIGFIWPSMLSICALGLCGFYPSIQAAFADAFCNNLVIFMLLVLVFTEYCEQSGINQKLAKWFLSRKILAGHPWRFSFMALLGCFVVSFLVDGNAVLFLVWNLLYTVFDEVGYKKGDAYPAFLCAGCVVAAVLSFACKPWCNVVIMASGALESVSNGAYTLDYLKFMIATIPICIMFLIAYFLVMKYMIRPDVSLLANLSDAYLENMRKELGLNKKEKIAIAALILFMILIILPNISWVKASGTILSTMNYLSALVVILIGLCLIHVDGEPILNFSKCAMHGVRWIFFWMTAAVICISSAVSNSEVGVSALIGDILGSFLTEHNVILFLVVFAIFINIATQLTHNVTLVVVAVPIGWQVCQATGLNPIAVTVLIILAAACAYATPAASTCSAIGFSNADWIGVRNSFKAGILAVLSGYIVLFLLGFPIIQLIYGFYL